MSRCAEHVALVLAQIGHVALLGERDELAQHFDVGFAIWLVADQDLDDLLEIEEPEGQIHIVGTDDFRPFPEGLRILAVDIEEEDMGLRVHSRECGAGSSATAQDLPVPVVPRTAKCLPSSSSIFTIAGIEESCWMCPMRMALSLSQA